MPLRPSTSPSTTPSTTRTLLPMVGQIHGNRSAVTCRLRCGDACSAPVPNTTETSYFRDVASTNVNNTQENKVPVTEFVVTAFPVGNLPFLSRSKTGR